MIAQANKHFLIIFLSLLCLSLASAETVYRSVDEKGVTEFSDRNKRGASEMELQKVPTYKFKKVKPPAAKAVTKSKDQAAIQIQIIRPVAEETIRSNQGDLTVEIKLAEAIKEGEKTAVETELKKKDPKLKSDHEEPAKAEQEPERAEKLKEGEKLLIILNDNIVLETDKSIVELKNIDRGIHHLKIAIKDAEGNLVTESEVVEFYMKRMSKLFKKPINPVKPKIAPSTPTP